MNNILFENSNLDYQVEIYIQKNAWCLQSIIFKNYC
jgi:hypothetical protein